STFVAARIAPPAAVETGDGKPRPPARIGLATIDLKRTAAVFGIELPEEEPAEAEGVRAYDPNAEPERSSLRATLIGTMVANRPEWSFATLRDDTAKEVGMYLPGDVFMGAEILEVERLRVI